MSKDDDKLVTWLPGNERMLAYDEEGRAVVLSESMVDTITRMAIPSASARGKIVEDDWGNVAVEITPPGVRVHLAYAEEADELIETLSKIAHSDDDRVPRRIRSRADRYRLVDALCETLDMQRLGQVAMNVLGYVDRERYDQAKESVDVWLHSEQLDEFFTWLRKSVEPTGTNETVE